MTGDDILKIEDRRADTVNVPEWNTTVTVKTMSLAERSAWEDAVMSATGPARLQVMARLVILATYNGDGRKLFEDRHFDGLLGMSSVPIIRIAQAAMRVNALTDEDIEGLEKNSESGQAGDSSSGSPSASAAPLAS